MKRKLALWLTVAGTGVLAGGLTGGCGTVRAGYETAPYRVVRASGRFEVRDYPVLTIAETPMLAGAKEADGSFGRLFRFITGGNESNQKIAMTTPVFMVAEDRNRTMAFVMPATMTADKVPAPSDRNVRVREMEPGRFAVLRFSGSRNSETEAEARERLSAWMKSEGLPELSAPVFAYFDPPWTPAFLRRNEVMIQTATADRTMP